MLTQPNNMQTNLIKFLLQDKKGQRLQNQQKDILQQKNFVAGKNLPYMFVNVNILNPQL